MKKETQLSQFNEFQIIRDFFGDHVGHFLDVGCSGGVSLSNTFQLGLLGWHGLLVEASPIHFSNLMANYIHRGGFLFLNAALWTERRLMKFHLNPYFYSSLIHKDEPNLFIGSYFVNTVTAEDLRMIKPAVDFISLDIEGADVLVFDSLMGAYPSCRLVCVEHANKDDIRQKWAGLFKKHGLTVVAETPENYIASR